MTFKWLVIGGGIHGCHIAARLVGDGVVRPHELGILDPGDALLARWRTFTETTGMTHLRSPSVHHIDLEPMSLEHFGRARGSRRAGLFVRPYRRPSLELFNAHCQSVLDRYDLHSAHIRDSATACDLGQDGVAVRTSVGRTLQADNVVLAMGAGNHPHWPSWALQGHPRFGHIFDQNLDGWPLDPGERVAVVGGGISAGQVALRLHHDGHQVQLVSRHALRQHQFDSDPGWLGPKYMTNFTRARDFAKRREMIQQARHRGSVPPDVRRSLRSAIRRGDLGWAEAEVEEAIPTSNGVLLKLSDGSGLDVNRVLLATGFESECPGGPLVQGLAESAGLQRAACGYPVVDRSLRWYPRVHVSGPLAELELGPAARNIAGAREAAKRIVGGVRNSDTGRWPAIIAPSTPEVPRPQVAAR